MSRDVAARFADRLRFWCVGCDSIHEVTLSGPHAWGWNGTLEQVTLSPSVLVRFFNGSEERGRCHSFVEDGRIRYLDDCSHGLRGLTVPLTPVNGWRFGGPERGATG